MKMLALCDSAHGSNRPSSRNHLPWNRSLDNDEPALPWRRESRIERGGIVMFERSSGSGKDRAITRLRWERLSRLPHHSCAAIRRSFQRAPNPLLKASRLHDRESRPWFARVADEDRSFPRHRRTARSPPYLWSASVAAAMTSGWFASRDNYRSKVDDRFRLALVLNRGARIGGAQHVRLIKGWRPRRFPCAATPRSQPGAPADLCVRQRQNRPDQACR